MTFPQTINASASPEVQTNENFASLAALGVYTNNPVVTAGLIRGYNAGRWGGFAYAGETHTFGASVTTYVSVVRSDGTLNFSTSSTNYNSASTHAKVETIVTSGSAVTSVTDDRAGPGGVHGGTAPGAGSGDASTNTASSVDDEVVLFSGTAGKTLKRASASGLLKLTSGVSSVLPALQCLAAACSDETTALTTGTNKIKFINPYGTPFILAAVVASLSTAQASGSIFTVDINEAGTTILSTKLTIDNTETKGGSPVAAGSATPAVISDASIAAYAEVSVDIDQIGDGTAKGLKVYLLGWPA